MNQLSQNQQNFNSQNQIERNKNSSNYQVSQYYDDYESENSLEFTIKNSMEQQLHDRKNSYN